MQEANVDKEYTQNVRARVRRRSTLVTVVSSCGMKTCRVFGFRRQVCGSVRGADGLVSGLLLDRRVLPAAGRREPSRHAVHPQDPHSLHARPAR